MVKKILFVCKYNRFRSKLAEAYFNRGNRNKNFRAESAGIFRGSYPLDSQQVRISKTQGLKIEGEPQGISIDLLKKTDIVVIVADDVPKSVFKFKGKYLQEVIVWKIKDENYGNEKNIKIIGKQIIKKVDKLIKELEGKR